MITKLKSRQERIISVRHIFMGISGFIVEVYALLLVESLHKKFRDEKFHHGGFIMEDVNSSKLVWKRLMYFHYMIDRNLDVAKIRIQNETKEFFF